MFGKSILVDTTKPMEEQTWFKSDLFSPKEKEVISYTWKKAGRWLEHKIKTGEVIIKA